MKVLEIDKVHDHDVKFVLILVTPAMKRKWKKMGSLRKESTHLMQQIFNEYFTCIPVLKMNSVLLLMGEDNKQAIIETEKYQRRSIWGELK